MRKQAQPLIAFKGLTQAQVNQIDEWLKEHPFRKVSEIIQEKFQRYISKSILQRFATWRCAKEALGSSPEAVAAAEEINQFAATAKLHTQDGPGIRFTFGSAGQCAKHESRDRGLWLVCCVSVVGDEFGQPVRSLRRAADLSLAWLQYFDGCTGRMFAQHNFGIGGCRRESRRQRFHEPCD